MHVQGHIEFSVVERSDEQVIAHMPVQPGIKNPFGVVHAGAMLWFADVTATVLVMGEGVSPSEGMKGFPLAINLSAQFVGNQLDGQLQAVATFVKRGRTVSVVRTQVLGTDRKLLAEVTTSHVLAK